MEYEIQSATQEESALFFSSTEKDKDEATGCIGHLRGDFGSGTEFWTTFWDHCEELKTQAFKDELDAIVNQLRAKGELLNNLSAMSAYCYAHITANFSSGNNQSYGYKVETDEHSFYIRCSPVRGDYNFYIYGYNRERLKQFLKISKNEGGL